MTAARPLLSVVMPCLDAMPDIGTALASARQHLAGIDHEIVVADGGSSDGTVEFLRDHGIRLVEGPDKSLYEGLNKAIAAARGSYVLWLNADDSLAAGVTALAAEAERAPVDMITGEARIDRDGETAWQSDHGATAMSAASILFGVPTINCRIIGTDALARVGPFRTDIGLGADREMMLRLLRACEKRRHLSALAYVYRAHSGSRTLAGDWDSYRRVHAANLALADGLAGNGSSSSAELDAYRAVSAMALARARLMSGGRDGGRLGELARYCRPVATARGLALYLANRGKASGW